MNTAPYAYSLVRAVVKVLRKIHHRIRSLRCLIGLLPLLLNAGGTESLPPFEMVDIETRKTTVGAPRGRGANVFIFILRDCPLSNQYQPTIRRLAEAFEPLGIRFHLIHADPNTTVEEARHHAEEYTIRQSVYLDPKHELVEKLSATISPEAVVLSSTNQKLYQGRINNLYVKLGQKRFRVTQHDLREALTDIAAGREIAPRTTPAIGCFIPTRESALPQTR